MEAAIRVAHEGGFVAAELRARNNLASVVWDREPRRAAALEWEAYELSRRLGDRSHANWALNNSVGSRWYAGRDWDEAVAEMSEAIAAVRGGTDEGRLASTLALITVARGEPTDETMGLLELHASQVSDPSAQAAIHFLRGERAWLAGDHQTAAIEIYEASRQEGMRTIYLPLAIRPALWHGDVARVRAMASELDAMPESEQPVTMANRAIAWADVAALEGRPAAALDGYRDGWRRYRDIGYDFEFARSVVDALHVLGPDDPELGRAANEAREIFERVRATPYLRLLDEALASAPGRARTALTPSESVEAAR